MVTMNIFSDGRYANHHNGLVDFNGSLIFKAHLGSPG